jgi:ferric-dicitrate binding protein FerR (iron transport regulator)
MHGIKGAADVNTTDYDLLLQGYLDNSLTAAQRADLARTLENDAALLKEFGEDTANATMIGAVLAAHDNESTVHSIMMLIDRSRPSQRHAAIESIRANVTRASSDRLAAPSHSRPLAPMRIRARRLLSKSWWTLAVAAGVMAVMVIHYGSSTFSPESAARIRIGAGCVVIRDSQTLAATAGMALRAGDRISADNDQGCSFAYSDGSVVEMNTGSVCILQQGGNGKTLLVERGDIYVTAVKQPASAPFVIRAHGADAEILGTELELSVAAGGTDLRVSEGRVRFGNNASAVLVADGHASRCANGEAPSPPNPIAIKDIAAWRHERPSATESTPSFLVRLEAENMPMKPYGGREYPGGWEIWGSEEYIQQNAAFDRSTIYRFDLTACGKAARNEWPIMELKIDQETVARFTVDSPDWKIFSASAKVNAGVHRVSVAFINDFLRDDDASEERNLYLDKIDISRTDADFPPSKPR